MWEGVLCNRAAPEIKITIFKWVKGWASTKAPVVNSEVFDKKQSSYDDIISKKQKLPLKIIISY